MDPTTQIILDELRSFRTFASEQFNEHGQRLTALEVGMKSLTGNGQPGRIQNLEASVGRLDRFRVRILAYLGIAAAVLTAGMTAAFKWLIQ